MCDAERVHGVTFPDFPGCFSAAAEWVDLPAAIPEAVQAHFHGEPETVPPPTALELLAADPQDEGGAWLLADVKVSRIDTRPVRLNVSLPSNLLQQIDRQASAHHMTRSGFLAKAAQAAMRE